MYVGPCCLFSIKLCTAFFHHALPPTPVSPVLGIYTESFKAHPCLCNSTLTAICYSWSFIGSKPCQKTSATCNLRSHSCFSEVTRNDLTTLPTPPNRNIFLFRHPHSSSWDVSPCKKIRFTVQLCLYCYRHLNRILWSFKGISHSGFYLQKPQVCTPITPPALKKTPIQIHFRAAQLYLSVILQSPLTHPQPSPIASRIQ